MDRAVLATPGGTGKGVDGQPWSNVTAEESHTLMGLLLDVVGSRSRQSDAATMARLKPYFITDGGIFDDMNRGLVDRVRRAFCEEGHSVSQTELNSFYNLVPSPRDTLVCRKLQKSFNFRISSPWTAWHARGSFPAGSTLPSTSVPRCTDATSPLPATAWWASSCMS